MVGAGQAGGGRLPAPAPALHHRVGAAHGCLDEGLLVREGSLGSPPWPGRRPRPAAPHGPEAGGAPRERAGGGQRGPRSVAAAGAEGHGAAHGGPGWAWEARGRARRQQPMTRAAKAGTCARRLERAREALGRWRDGQEVEETPTSAAE